MLDELELSHEDSNVQVWSSTDEVDEVTGLLNKYIRNVNIGSRPENLSFGESFEELPEQFAFDLFSAYYLLR